MTGPQLYGPRSILRDALTAKCTLTPNPITTLTALATHAGVGVRAIAKASIGEPVPTIAHLRLCAALEVDPLAGIGPAHYGLHKAYPTPSDFDFPFFAMALTIRQGLQRHDSHKACKAIGIKAGTLVRLKLGHVMPIGPVLRACVYVGVHPFGYFAAVSAVVHSESKTKPNDFNGVFHVCQRG